MKPAATLLQSGSRSRSALRIAVLAAVLLAGALLSDASARTPGRISAHLTSTRFTAAQAPRVKLTYKFSSKSARFGYVLSRERGTRWTKVLSVSRRGSFTGSHTMTVSRLFAGKPITVASYRVTLSSATNSVALKFRVVTPSSPVTHTLTVSSAGTGAGTVTSSPSGIRCPGTCRASFKVRTQVTLTATAVSGSTFGGWSGAGCSGNAKCRVTLSSDTRVTATFNTNAVAPKSGTWVATVSGVSGSEHGSGPGGDFTVSSVFFTVAADHKTISSFGFKYDWREKPMLCGATGSGSSTEDVPSAITNSQFSTPSGQWTSVGDWGQYGSGGFAGTFRGTISSATSAHGTGQASGSVSTSCSSGSGGGWMGSTGTFYWSATWRSS